MTDLDRLTREAKSFRLEYTADADVPKDRWKLHYHDAKDDSCRFFISRPTLDELIVGAFDFKFWLANPDKRDSP